MRSLIESLLRIEQVDEAGAEISVVFCDDVTIRALNRRYRRQDRATDVLAFSQAEGDAFPRAAALGDVVISVETAERQARARACPLATEIEWLLLHGALHLLGYDHPNDAAAAAMDQRARQALQLAAAHPWVDAAPLSGAPAL